MVGKTISHKSRDQRSRLYELILQVQFGICNLQFAICNLHSISDRVRLLVFTGREVVVYTALDSEFSQPIFDDFTAATGIAVRPKFDTESTKTVGLTEAILAERNRPRCDVFWNNEILNTLRLQRQGSAGGVRFAHRPILSG